ncbi:MAG: hypothetical protein IPN69_01065 [Acidobacteria bacterium]|nr:hypothetical protein [Acidobacteriota bacterium]
MGIEKDELRVEIDGAKFGEGRVPRIRKRIGASSRSIDAKKLFFIRAKDVPMW